MLADVLVQHLLEARQQLVRLHRQLRQEVQEDAARHRGRVLGHTWIQHRVLQLLHGRRQAFQERLVEGVHIHLRVVEAAHEELRGWRPVPVDRRLRGQVDVGGGPDLLVDPLQAVGPVQGGQLHEAGEGGPHVARQAALAPLPRLLAHGEGGEARVPRGLRQGQAHLPDAGRPEELCFPGEGLHALGQHPRQGVVGVVEAGAVADPREGVAPHDNVQQVQRHLPRTTAHSHQLGERALRQGALEAGEAGEDQEDSAAAVRLPLARRELLGPGRPEGPVALAHVDPCDAGGRGEPVHIGPHGAALHGGVGIAEELDQQLHVQAAVTRHPRLHGDLLLGPGEVLAEPAHPLLVVLAVNQVHQLPRQVPQAAEVACRGRLTGELGELEDLVEGRVARARHAAGHVHARRPGALSRHHLPEHGKHCVLPLGEPVVRQHYREGPLWRAFELTDQLAQLLVVGLLGLDRLGKTALVHQEPLQQLLDALCRILCAGKRAEELLCERRPALADLEAIQECGKVLFRAHLLWLASLRATAEVTLEGLDLLNLRWVLQLQPGEQLACRHDAPRALGMRDLARLPGLQRHDHLHGLQLDVRLALGHLGALVVQVPHDLAVHVRAELRRVVDGRQHDRGRADRQAQAHRLLAALEGLHGPASAGIDRPVRLLSDLCLELRGADAEDERVLAGPHHLECEALPVKDNLQGEGGECTRIIPAKQHQLALLHGGQHLLRSLLHELVGAVDGRIEDHLQGPLARRDELLRDEPVEPHRVDGVLLEGVRLEELDEVGHRVPDVPGDVDVLEREA
mmetsp:Transcript_22266/g.70166  ORF Transcript_22266/g.70166 Transcript_22266/m.70166 type:complete len:797 (-) Transcript_22266:422-2812(-)